MSEDGSFFAMRLKELRSPAIVAMRHPNVGGSRKILCKQSAGDDELSEPFERLASLSRADFFLRKRQADNDRSPMLPSF